MINEVVQVLLEKCWNLDCLFKDTVKGTRYVRTFHSKKYLKEGYTSKLVNAKKCLAFRILCIQGHLIQSSLIIFIVVLELSLKAS